MKNLSVLSVLMVFVLFMSGLAYAAETDQKTVFVTAEKGKSFTFSLYMENVAQDESIRVDSNVSGWFSWGDIPRPTGYLSFTIRVPDNATTGSYYAEIKANDKIVSIVSINVVFTFPEATLDDINKIESRVDEIKSTANTIKTTGDDLDSRVQSLHERLNSVESSMINNFDSVKSEMDEYSGILKTLSDNQKRVNELEAQHKQEISAMENKITSLESTKKNLETRNEETMSITGRVIANWSSVAFSVGLIAGIVIVVFFTRMPRVQRVFSGMRLSGSSPSPKPQAPSVGMPSLNLDRFKKSKPMYNYKPQ